MCLHVHARGTTGADAGARRAHVYATRCTQCGVALTPTTRVAAHVRVFACGCVPHMRLVTACKACNHPHARRPRSFWKWRVRGTRV